MYLKVMNFLVLGLKRSGYAVSKLLLEKGAKVYLYDDKLTDVSNNNVCKLISLGATLVENPNSILDSIDVLVLSPAVAIDNPICVTAKEMGIRIIGEIELASYFVTSPIVAVTGTNGKTTVCSIISHVLQKAGYDNALLGNIGTPLSQEVNNLGENTICVLEVSSYQLETTARFCPHIACVLNISPDHLSRHYNMENYTYLKSKIVRTLKESEYAVLNHDDKTVREFSSITNGKVKYFSIKNEVDGAYVKDGKFYYQSQVVCDISALSIGGEHNLENALASIVVLKLLNVSNEDICQGLKSFVGIKHRIQLVRELNGVKIYNDSKSTNPDSCIRAINSMKDSTVLIMGGYEKGLNYDDLFENIKNQQKVKSIVLTGASSQKMLESAVKCKFYNVLVVNDFYSAIKIAVMLSKNTGAVLFSPATSSFDMFTDYEERGDKFIEIVNSL